MPVLPMYEFDYYNNTGGSILREERANEDAKIRLDLDTHRHVCREETNAMLSSPSPSPRRSFSTSYSTVHPSSPRSAIYASDLARPSTMRTYTSTSTVTRPSDYYYPAASTARSVYEQGYVDGLTGSPRRYY